jgi:GAF domain-containing protein
MTDPQDASRPSGDPVSGLSFAHAARLQFDEILEQLVASARQVQATQGRLRGLLRAYLAVARADDLDDVLRHIVEAARTLVDANYAALGVVAGNGLVRFIHSGMDAETVRQIGHLPEGKGVLGLLVDRPEPLRLLHIADHVASVGFPDHHPPMTTFLGVPIRVADRVFGNIYATDKNDGNAFTSDDEELLLALAAAAGVAIQNATLLTQGRRRQAWQSAMMELATDLLGEADLTVALGRLVHSARETLEGSGALAAVPTGDPSCLRVVAAEGVYQSWTGAELVIADSLLEEVIGQGMPVAAEPSRLPTGAVTAGLPPVGQSVALPLAGEHGTIGVLLVSRDLQHEPIDGLDWDIVAGLASQAGLVLRLADTRRDNERLRLMADREQIGEDLRERVIQRLFRHELALQGAADRAFRPDVAQRLQEQIEEVDAIIRDLRDAILTFGTGE